MRYPAILAAAASVLLLGPLCAAASAAAHPAAAAAHPASNGRIAFSQGDLFPGGNLSGHSNVYTIKPDGAGRQQLTHVAVARAAAAPDWSPDGAEIAYESNQTGDFRIWVMKSDGSGKKRLTSDPGFADLSPDWSPAGTRILFSRCDDHLGFSTYCDVDVIRADGTGMRRLAGGHWTYVRAEYSPDGRRIVVGADRGGYQGALWIMRSDGSRRHRITRPALEAFWPGWSPDGRRIIFTGNCCRPGSNIWTIRPDGRGLRQLTHFGPPPLEGDFASYSPDGRRIVLHYNGKCPVRGTCPYFYVMHADGSGLRAVKTRVANTLLTAWGPAR
jgi:TolB protein